MKEVLLHHTAKVEAMEEIKTILRMRRDSLTFEEEELKESKGHDLDLDEMQNFV